MKEKMKTTVKPIKVVYSVSEFVEWVCELKSDLLLENDFMLYRGLASCDYEVVSSAERRILPDTRVLEYTKQLLKGAKRGRSYKEQAELTDLELLAELQHHGAATFLIDFTKHPLVALWFACLLLKEKNINQDGKVVAVQAYDARLKPAEEEIDKEIDKFFAKGKLWKWSPGQINKRIITQQSVFVFGGGHLNVSDYKSVEIAQDKKLEIRNELKEKFGINEEYLFSDLSGFAVANAYDKPYQSADAEGFVLRALQHSKMKEFDAAITCYNKAEKLGLNHPILHNNRGVARGCSGKSHEAIKDFDKAIKMQPTYVSAYSNRGSAKSDLGKPQEAIKDYDKAIELDPEYVDAYYNRGNAKGDLGKSQEAIKDYDKAIELDPEYASAYNNRGNAKGLLGKFQDAIKDHNKAIELDPENAKAYNNRGDTKCRLGKFQDAIKDFDKAIELDPEYAIAYYNRGNTKGRLGKFQDAIKDYDKAIELVPENARAYNNRGHAKGRLGKPQEAIKDFDKAIELDPGYADAYTNRGNVKCRLGKFQDAIKDFDRAIELDPEDAVAYYNRGVAKRGMGDDVGAEEDFAKAFELDPSLRDRHKEN